MAVGDIHASLNELKAKRCAIFDGVDDYVDCGKIDIKGWSEFSMSCWINIAELGSTERWLSILHSGGDDIRIWTHTDGKLYFSMDDGDAESLIFDNPEIKVWYHVVGVFDGSNVYFYVNNSEIGSSSETFDFSTADGAVTIGAIGAGSNSVDGAIRDARIYKKALTSTERTKLYNGLNVTDGLVHRYKLDFDYTDSVGDNDGTNSGSYLSAVDDNVSAAIKANRTTANDNYMLTTLAGGKILHAVVEESA